MNFVKTSNRLLASKLKNQIQIIGKKSSTYEPTFEPNKTIIELVSKNQETRYITGISNFGFRLNNGLFAIGPIVIFNEILLSWNIRSVKEINPHSLSFFRMFVPKFDVIVLGVGDSVTGLHPDLIPWLSRNRVPYEIHNSKDAAKLYNSMVIDRRNVAAAIVPPIGVGVPNRDDAGSDSGMKALEAKVTHQLWNDMFMTRAFIKHYEEFWLRMKEQYISKERLKAQIVARNLALKERGKQMKFEDAIEEEIKAIKEEEELFKDKPPIGAPRTQFAKKPKKPKAETDESKLIE